MNRKSDNKQTVFFRRATTRKLADVGQYNLFSNFTTNENTTERRIILVAFLNEIISYENFSNDNLTSTTTYQIYFGYRST